LAPDISGLHIHIDIHYKARSVKVEH